MYRTTDPTKRLMHHFNFEVMDIFPLPNVKSYLASFVGDAISDFWAEHEMLTFHEVVHAVFELRDTISCIKEVEIYNVISNNLKSNITLDIVDESSGVDVVKLLP